MTRHILIALTLLVVALAPAAAWPADMEGKIQSVDAGERTITLENGTKVWLADGIAVDLVKEGAVVRVSYEDKDGKPVATSVEVK
jgi:hypothetical protein